MSVTRPPAPPELLKLRTVVNYALETIAATEQWCEIVADVNRLIQPDYARRLDALRSELALAQRPGRVGTVAAITRLVAELLGETAP